MFQEKVLTCKICGAEFVFSASEQEFYAEKGFTNEPGRCPSCRAARKQQTAVTAAATNAKNAKCTQQSALHVASHLAFFTRTIIFRILNIGRLRVFVRPRRTHLQDFESQLYKIGLNNWLD